MIKTKIDAELARAEEQHASDPERAELIARARRFKASWLELAEALTHVRKHETWKRWSFDSFEQYASRELRLRMETVEKLTGSYAFLRNRAPAVLDRDGVTESIPSYQAIDFLRRAEERDDAPLETVSAIRKRVLDEGASLPAVSREFGETVFPIDQSERKRRDLVAVRQAATRLRDALASTRAVPRSVVDDITAKLDELLEVVDSKKSAAA